MSDQRHANNVASVDGHPQEPMLRFITCGSVDDGKSTLLGRLLFETQAIFDDQYASIERESRIYGTQGAKPDLALLVDGLEAEREQGITIDVAYRYFTTDKRRYIVADTPGHEQYTRNMATGASTADLAIILIDATKGLQIQTRRHSRIVAMMGIRHVVVAVNKMDLVDYNRQLFEQIASDYRAFVEPFGFETLKAIPLSALEGDNIVSQWGRTDWYDGPSLIQHLDSVVITQTAGTLNPQGALRLPVQWINRPNPQFRGICGRIGSGSVRKGDTIRIQPSGVTSRVRQVWRGFHEVERASADESVMLSLEDEVDVSRGDVISGADNAPESADQFEIRLIWMHEQPLVLGRQYLMMLGCREVTASVTAIKYREDVNTGAHLATRSLSMNEIAVVHISTNAPVVFEPYSENRVLGGLILVDKLSFDTVGAGMVCFALRRAQNIHWQSLEVNKAARAGLKHQTPRCIWFTGLSGSGKSTIANLLEVRLHAEGHHTFLLDGDNIRHGLNRDLGFTDADRVENIRRVAEVARLMVDAGLIVLVSFISPFRAERSMARALFFEGEFVEVFVDTPIEECERRDPKGLYAKARRGELKNFTGIDSLYEEPEAPEIHILTSDRTAGECAGSVEEWLSH